MHTLLAISNASAGSSDEDITAAVLDVLGERWEVSSVSTEGPDDLAQALADHPDVDVVAALGGDGSLHAVVQALSDADRLPATALALIPLGTGNDFARTLGLPDDPVEAARLVAAGEIAPIDLIRGGGDVITINAAHVGLGAEAAAKAEPIKPWLGPLAYVVGAARTLFLPSRKERVTIDGRVLSGRVAQVAVGNGRFVGGGGELLPEAVIDDGLMDVAVAFAATIRQRIVYAWRLSKGTHPTENFVVYEKARQVEVSGESMRCTNDGELSERQSRFHWRIDPGAVRMVLPRGEESQTSSS